ncbi:hypothetical protein VTK73DRAFT_1945 [Phialemonium thermophilum]|uniref:Uncharacterized protein n=1 Tax=Phialemonium thermophilum TaxID=223376 RepID=A0ABR3VST2_9PEZI
MLDAFLTQQTTTKCPCSRHEGAHRTWRRQEQVGVASDVLSAVRLCGHLDGAELFKYTRVMPLIQTGQEFVEGSP